MIYTRFRHILVSLMLGAGLALMLGAVVEAQSGGGMKITRWTLTASTGGTFSGASVGGAGTMSQPILGVSSAERYNSGGIWSLHHIRPNPSWVDLPQFIESEGADDFQFRDATQPEGSALEGGEYFPGPDSFECPAIPQYTIIDFPASLNLPDMPVVALMTYVTSTHQPILELTESLAEWRTVIELSELLPEEIAEALGITGVNWDEGDIPDLNALEFGGYTASEMATELTDGIDMALSYIRGLSSIGVIGPAAAALLVGLAWIAFITIVQLLLRSLMIWVRLLVRIWELVPFT